MNPCIPVYSLLPAIDKTYNTSAMIQVASVAVDRDPVDGDHGRARPGIAPWTRNSQNGSRETRTLNDGFRQLAWKSVLERTTISIAPY